MIIFLIFLAIAVVGIILGCVFDKKAHDILSFLFSVLGIICAIITIGSLVYIIGMRITAPYKYEGLKEERKALVWQMENDRYDGSSNAIGEFNKNVVTNQMLLNDIWTSWYASPAYGNIELVPLK